MIIEMTEFKDLFVSKLDKKRMKGGISQDFIVLRST